MTAEPRCSACEHADATAIDAALRAGQSVRDIAAEFGISKSAVQRHRGHAGIPAPARRTRRDHLAAALELLGRARSERDQLRALSGARAAMALELRDLSRVRAAVRAPTDQELDRLRANLSAAWSLFEAVRERPNAGAALSGVRESLAALRVAERLSGRDEAPPVLCRIVWDGPTCEFLIPAAAFGGKEPANFGIEWPTPGGIRTRRYELPVHAGHVNGNGNGSGEGHG